MRLNSHTLAPNWEQIAYLPRVLADVPHFSKTLAQHVINSGCNMKKLQLHFQDSPFSAEGTYTQLAFRFMMDMALRACAHQYPEYQPLIEEPLQTLNSFKDWLKARHFLGDGLGRCLLQPNGPTQNLEMLVNEDATKVEPVFLILIAILGTYQELREDAPWIKKVKDAKNKDISAATDRAIEHLKRALKPDKLVSPVDKQVLQAVEDLLGLSRDMLQSWKPKRDDDVNNVASILSSKGLWREEYNDVSNAEHTRQNLLTLFDSLCEAERSRSLRRTSYSMEPISNDTPKQIREKATKLRVSNLAAYDDLTFLQNLDTIIHQIDIKMQRDQVKSQRLALTLELARRLHEQLPAAGTVGRKRHSEMAKISSELLMTITHGVPEPGSDAEEPPHKEVFHVLERGIRCDVPCSLKPVPESEVLTACEWQIVPDPADGKPMWMLLSQPVSPDRPDVSIKELLIQLPDEREFIFSVKKVSSASTSLVPHEKYASNLENYKKSGVYPSASIVVAHHADSSRSMVDSSPGLSLVSQTSLILRFLVEIISSSKLEKHQSFLEHLAACAPIPESGSALVSLLYLKELLSLPSPPKLSALPKDYLFSVAHHVRYKVLALKSLENLRAVLDQHWTAALEMEHKYENALRRDSKQILQHLLRPAEMSSHTIAVIRDEQRRYILDLIRNNTIHIVTEKTIEHSNFQATLSRLKRLNKQPSVSFVILRVVGRLSELELKQIVETISEGSLRLLIVLFPKLLSSLRVVSALSKVYDHQLMNHDEANNVVGETAMSVKASHYADDILYTRLLRAATEYYSEKPEKLNCITIKDHLLSSLKSRLNWKREFDEWVSRFINFNEIGDVKNNMYRVMVASSTEVKIALTSNDASGPASAVLVIDSSDASSKDSLKALFDNASIIQTSFQTTGESRQYPTVVVLNAHLLSRARKAHLASRCLEKHARVALVVPYDGPEDLFLRVKREGLSEEIQLSGHIMRPLMTLGKSRQEINLSKLARGVFGPLAALISPLVPDFDSSKAAEILSFEISSFGISKSRIKSTLDALKAAIMGGERSVFQELPPLLGFIVETLARRILDEEDCLVVSFYDFVCLNPYCQLLPQTLIVEAWLRTCLDLEDPQPIYKRFELSTSTNNVHSVHLLAFFSPSLDSKFNSSQPFYQYAQADFTADPKELILHECAQKHELNWNALSEEWKQFPYDLTFLVSALVAHHSPFKILSLIDPLSFYSLLDTASEDAYNAAIASSCSWLLNDKPLMAHLRDRVTSWKGFAACLKWSLCIHNIEAERPSPDELPFVIEANMPLTVSKLSNEQRISALSMLLSQRTVQQDLLYNKVTLREYLLTVEITQIRPIWDNVKLHFLFGASTIEFFLKERVAYAVTHASNAPNLFIGMKLWQSIVTWFKGTSETLVIPEDEKKLLSTDALGYLLSRAPSTSRAKGLVNIVDGDDIFALLRAAEHFEARLDLIASFIDGAVEGGKLGDGDGGPNLSTYAQHLIQALQSGDVSEWPGVGPGVPLVIPVKHCKGLLLSFCRHFSDEKFPNRTWSEAITKVVSLLDRESEVCLLRHMSKRRESGNLESGRIGDDNKFLLWLLWLRNPSELLVTPPGSAEELKSLKSIAEHPNTNFHQLLSEQLDHACQLALYLACPYYLDDFSLDVLMRRYEDKPLKRNFVSLMSSGKQEPVPWHRKYFAVVPERPFPRSLLESLLRRPETLARVEQPPEELNAQTVTELCNRAQVGQKVDQAALWRNVDVLVLALLSASKTSDGSCKNTIILLGRLLLLWFSALGCEREDVEKCLLAQTPAGTDIVGHLESLEQETENFGLNLNAEPIYKLPAVFNLALSRGSAAITTPFGPSDADTVWTMDRVLLAYDSEDNHDAISLFEDSMEQDLDGLWRATEFYKFELHTHFGANCGTIVQGKLLSDGNPSLAFVYETIYPFVSTWILVNNVAKRREMMERFVKVLFAEFENPPSPHLSWACVMCCWMILRHDEELRTEFVDIVNSLENYELEDNNGQLKMNEAHWNLFQIDLNQFNKSSLWSKLNTTVDFVGSGALSGELKINQGAPPSRKSRPRSRKPISIFVPAPSSAGAVNKAVSNSFEASVGSAASVSFSGTASSKAVTVICPILFGEERPISNKEAVVALKVLPGDLCSLVATDSHLELVRGIPEATPTVALICSFQNHDEAFSWLSSNLPPLSLLVGKQFMLKKVLQGRDWVVITRPKPLIMVEITRRLDRLVDIANLVNLDLDPGIDSICIVVLRIVYAFYLVVSGTKKPPRLSRSELLTWFRNFQAPSPKSFISFSSIFDRVTHIVKSCAAAVSTDPIDLETQCEALAASSLNGLSRQLGLSSKQNLYNFWRAQRMTNKVCSKISTCIGSKEVLQKLLEGEHKLLSEIERTVTEPLSLRASSKPEDPKQNFCNPFAISQDKCVGYGSLFAGLHHVHTINGPSPSYHVAYVDQVALKVSYNDSSGLIFAYLLEETLFQRISHGQTDRLLFAKWLVDVVRAPLSKEYRDWLLNIILASPQRSFKQESSLVHAVVADCVARACPDLELKATLSANTDLNRQGTGSVLKFCRRIDDKYGVYICTSEVGEQLSQEGLDPQRIDLRWESTSTNLDHLYLQIISRFSDVHNFVYISGMRNVDDLLLKWMCEYTASFPWRFVYLENASLMFNFAENRDRCNFSLLSLKNILRIDGFEAQEVVYETSPFYEEALGDKSEKLGKLVDERIAANNISTRAAALDSAGWEKRLQKHVDEHDMMFTLVTSPPGAGKTFLLEHTILPQQRDKGVVCHRIDCSSDSLVERTLFSILEEKFPDETRYGMLVADEYHMLSAEHKEELALWGTSHIHYIKIICIGNRFNDFDEQLLERVRRSVGDGVLVDLIKCRLHVDKIISVCKSQDTNIPADLEDILRSWHICIRNLFSDEAVSLRNVKAVADAFRQMDRQAKSARLQQILLQKVPFVGEFCASQVVEAFLALHSQLLEGAPVSYQSPIYLLVHAALLDKNDNSWSYREFVTRFPRAHELHPMLRFGLWVFTVMEQNGISRPAIYNLPLQTLRTLEVVDQAIFPRIVSFSVGSNAKRCLSLSKSGDFSDLAWLSDIVTRGYSVNWEKVKIEWQRHNIAHAAQLERLVSCCPSPSACLSCVSDANLCSLIRSSTTKEAGSLAEKVLEFRPLGDSEATSSNSPYYNAAWYVIRMRKDAIETLRRLQVNIVDVLVWASQFGSSQQQVSPNVDPLEQQHALTTILIEQSSILANDVDPQSEIKLVSLWDEFFAPLLHEVLSSWNSGSNRMQKALFIVASRSGKTNPAWPEPFCALIRLMHQQDSQSADIEILSEFKSSTGKLELHDLLKVANPDGLYPNSLLISGICKRLSSVSEAERVQWMNLMLQCDVRVSAKLQSNAIVAKTSEVCKSHLDPSQIKLKFVDE